MCFNNKFSYKQQDFKFLFKFTAIMSWYGALNHSKQVKKVRKTSHQTDCALSTLRAAQMHS